MSTSLTHSLTNFLSKFGISSIKKGKGLGKDRKPRVLYFMVNYPAFSETYMHEEIRTLRGEYNIKIIAYKPCFDPRRDPFPYSCIPYQDSCLVYGSIKKVDRSFNTPKQQEFIQEVEAVIKEFAPDIMHAHYFGLGLLLEWLAERHQIPFTIRTHSMDILSEPQEKIETLCEVANSAWCQRILAYPPFVNYLVDSGLHPDKVVGCWPAINFGRFYRPTRRPPTGRILCAGPAIPKKAHTEFIDLAGLMQGQNLTFDLYTKGDSLKPTEEYNQQSGNVARITYAEPEAMPKVYPLYDWVVYPSDTKINKVGFPAVIAEAQASGLGVCWQELPGRREEQLEFLGGGGFLFQSIDEVPAILSREYPEEMRQAGLENARKFDIAQHKVLLTEAWEKVVGDKALAS